MNAYFLTKYGMRQKFTNLQNTRRKNIPSWYYFKI